MPPDGEAWLTATPEATPGQAVKRRQVFGGRATQYQSDTSDVVAERARFELANGVRPLRHFQCGLPKPLMLRLFLRFNCDST